MYDNIKAIAINGVLFFITKMILAFLLGSSPVNAETQKELEVLWTDAVPIEQTAEIEYAHRFTVPKPADPDNKDSKIKDIPKLMIDIEVVKKNICKTYTELNLDCPYVIK